HLLGLEPDSFHSWLPCLPDIHADFPGFPLDEIRLLLTGLSCRFGIRSNLDRHLEPEVFLRGTMKWLPVANPEGVEGRVRCKLHRGCLAQQQRSRVSCQEVDHL